MKTTTNSKSITISNNRNHTYSTVRLLKLASMAYYLYNQIEEGDMQSLEELDLTTITNIEGVNLFNDSNNKPFSIIRDQVKNLKDFVDYMINNLVDGNKIPFKFMLDSELNIYIYRIDLEDVYSNPISETEISPINFAMYEDEILDDLCAEISINGDSNYDFIKYIKIPDFVTGLRAPLYNLVPGGIISQKNLGLEATFFPIYDKEDLDNEKATLKALKALKYVIPKPFSIISDHHENNGENSSNESSNGESSDGESSKSLIVLKYNKGQKIDLDNLINNQDEHSPDPNKTTGVYLAEIEHKYDCKIKVNHGNEVKEINGFKVMGA